MLTIRLTRKGKKNQPFFRVVLVDKRRSSKSGNALEDLGFKDPLTKKISLKKDRILHWISKGAKPSPSMHNLLVSQKVINEKKIKITNISKKKQTEMSEAKKAAEAAKAAPAQAPAAAVEAKPATEAPKAEEPKPTA